MFDGTLFHGWQKQENAIGIEQILENALCKLTNENTQVVGCSRTDAGVHASEYVCNFFSNTKVTTGKFPFALNTFLPKEIRAFKCEIVPNDFHARFDAKSKEYTYQILNATYENPHYRNFAWHFRYPLDFDKMERAAKMLTGKIDFSAFMASGGQQKQMVKDMKSITIEKTHDLILINFHADSYLYNMVRILTGTIIYIGCGKIPLEALPQIILSKDRTLAGITAPPGGLFLKKVHY